MLEHFYQQVPGFFSFQPVYDLGLSRVPNGGKWVEIGSWQGKSLSYAVVESLRKGKKIEFHCVDIWMLSAKHQQPGLETDQDLYESFVRHTNPIREHFTVHRCLSNLAADQFSDNTLDFVMIDADHSYEAVIKDIRAWWPKIKPGGLLVGDDLRGSFPGVRQAITEFASEHCLAWAKQSGCWLLER
jgi:hypothetical protein